MPEFQYKVSLDEPYHITLPYTNTKLQNDTYSMDTLLRPSIYMY